MVNNSQSLDAVFGALADPTRRAILMQLADRPMWVTELAEPFDISLPAASKHIRVLARAGLLRQTKVGRNRKCEIVADALGDAQAWINQVEIFWSERLNALDKFLNDDTQKGNQP